MAETWGWYCLRHNLWMADEAAITAHVSALINQTHYITGARKVEGLLP